MRRVTRLLVIFGMVATLLLAPIGVSEACYVGVNGIGVQVC